MRVVNDREENSDARGLGFFEVLSHALLCALGISTFLFSSLPMIMARLKLVEPWSQAAALVGAVTALFVFETPLAVVIVGYICGLYIADAVEREVPLGKLFVSLAVLSLVAGGALVWAYALAAKTGVTAYWTSFIADSVDRSGLQAFLQPRHPDFRVDSVKSMLLTQGPSLYLSVIGLSAWLSIGATAHFGWLSSGHRFSANSLRSLSFPVWGSVVYIGVFLSNVALPLRYQWLSESLLRLVGVGMLIQGSVYLSSLVEARRLQQRTRTLIYLLAFTAGFYVVMALGIVSPWLAKRRFKGEMVSPNDGVLIREN